MNGDIVLAGKQCEEKLMSTQELARALGVSESTIRQEAINLGLSSDVRRKSCGGRPGMFFSEAQATQIKQAIEHSGRNDLESIQNVSKITTELEMVERTVEVLQWQRDKLNELGLKLKEAEPKIACYDQCMSAGNSFDMMTIAKIMNNPRYGRNRIFKILREHRVLMENNLPYQPFIANGAFRVYEEPYTTTVNGKEITNVNHKTVVTQRGMDLIRKIINEDDLGNGDWEAQDNE